MISNYLKIILRSFTKNQSYNLLNLTGLAIGFSAFLLIGLYLVYETSFERFHTKADRIYRLTVHYTSNTGYDTHFARVDADWTKTIPDEIPEVNRLVRFQNHEPKFVRIGQEKFTAEHAYATDATVFEVFDFPLLKGDPNSALAEPFSVVLTKSMAAKYFGEEEAYGKELVITRYWTTDEEVYKITGIMEDMPSHTHLPVNMLVSFRNEQDRSWWAYTYLLLNEGADTSILKEKIENLMAKNEGEESRESTEYGLQPLPQIHLHSNLAREISLNGNILFAQVFFGVAIFILLVAMVNFINLNSVLALGRAKEIGLRKVMGSHHTQLIGYSLVESTLLSLLAALLACIIVYFVFPYFQGLIGIENLLPNGIILLLMGGLALLTGLLSGIYPAFVLSSMAPLNVLKSNANVSLANSHNRFNFRKVLITCQFAICILLIGSALICRKQFIYLNEKNLGLKKEQVLALTAVPDTVKDKFKSFKDELLSKPGISGVSACLEVPSREIRDGGSVEYEGMVGSKDEAPVMDIQVTDHDFINVMGLELLAGESLPESLTYDPIPELNGLEAIQQYLISKRRAYIINEIAMRKMGWTRPDEAVGKYISWSNVTMALAKGPIVGVVKDFHQETLRNKVDPIVMVFEPLWLRTFLIKLSTDNSSNSIATVEAVWNKLFPQYPFEYAFIDELYEKLYKNEKQQIQLLYTLSGLAIFIAFLGLFGLTAYTLKTRSKEIAVRKIFGANYIRLLKLFSREYLQVVIIASFVAIPASYYGVTTWLENFAYRVPVSWGNYLFPILLILIVLIGTIGYHTIKGTMSNPIESLREN
jgi:putative ABC transport system permease protein